MTVAADHHYAMPLPWLIGLMVVAGAFGFWIVTWAIPKFLTDKSPVWDRASWRDGAWHKRTKGNWSFKPKDRDFS
jgi:hypothetical protein